MTRSRYLAVSGVLAAAVLATGAAAAGAPVEIPAGTILIVRTQAAEKWYVTEAGATGRQVLVITVGADGSVAMQTIPLPDRQGPAPDPDDPPQPPQPEPLDVAVDRWAGFVNDPTSRMKLAAAYEAMAQLMEQGKVTVEQLLGKDGQPGLQALTNSTVLGASAPKWRAFFESLAAHLDNYPPADIAGYTARWREIVAGLKRG